MKGQLLGCHTEVHGMQVGVLVIGARDFCRLSLLLFVSRRSERAWCYQFVVEALSEVPR